MSKIFNARSQPFFYSLNLVFGDVLVAMHLRRGLLKLPIIISEERSDYLNCPIAVIAVISSFTCRKRRKDQFCFELTLLPRLHF